VTAGSVTVSANLVRHLRAGVKRDLRETLTDLHNEMDTEVADADVYEGARARYNTATALLDAVGLNDHPAQAELELALDPWPDELLRALDSQLQSERTRLDRGRAQGFSLSRDHMPGLTELVEEVRQRTGQPPRTHTDMSYLEREQRRHPRPRPRGDG
jgi:hypothetical protein